MKRFISLIATAAIALAAPAVAAFSNVARAVGENLHSLLFRHMARNGLILGVETLDPAVVEKGLAAIKEQVQEVATKHKKEVDELGTATAATKKIADDLLVKQGEMMAQMSEVMQKMDKVGQGSEAQQLKSSGEQLVESPEFKEFVARGGFKAAGMAVSVGMKAITGLTGAAGGVLVAPDRRPGIIVEPMRRMTVRDLITPGRTSSNLIEFFRELLFTNSAAPVSETVLKPESNITFEEASARVVTIAHWLPASKQIMDDVPQLQSFVDGRMRYGLELVEEAQLLKGSGVGNNISGIYTQATAYSLPSGATTPAQRIDKLRAMILQAALAEYPVDGIVLHPTDWYNIEILKTTDGAYLFANPTGTVSPTLWGRNVVATQAMTQDTALVGAFRMGAQIFDKEDANVVVSSEDVDNFRKNMLTVRAEERLALVVYRSAAFIKDTNLDG
jgi:HK97 family phage major capsid protein